ncbi:3-[(3aS,4S,7aS)-7a-methyl-1,5-dioxo-octahydro-1H-inden-4-yl]propanoyl:CoA ligase-like [Littorina saxatilis]|uniref:Medium-chain acyl-CoA ligase ACSF2, mitochondrial n=1 Tax=Littorina saxatilis TaxID=31220 RepID=A0AAN9BEV9_9CAEN
MDPESRTVPAMLRHWATVDPDTPAFIYVLATGGRCVLTRADLFRLSSRYAAILRRNGVKPGTTVCNTLFNSPERMVTDFGIILAGGVAMNSQPFLSDGEDLIVALKESAAIAVIVDPLQPRGAAKFLNQRATSHPQTGQVTYSELPALKQVFEVHYSEDDSEKRPFIDLLEKEQDSYVADVTPSEIAVLWSSSGTTGFSKLIPASHDGVIGLGNCLYKMQNMRPEDIFFNNLPNGWAVGFPSVFLAHGTTRVMPDCGTELPPLDWDCIPLERCTVAFLVPFDILQLVDLVRRKGNDEDKQYKLRAIMSSGQPLMKNHMEAIGIITDSIQIVYGCSETGLISYKTVTDKDSYENCNNGPPASGVEVRVVNTDLSDQPVGQLGEILVRTASLIGGYLTKEATQRAFIKDGWYRTGDTGYINDKGEIFTICRTANNIMRGSVSLYPGWLERRINRCPGVETVVIVPVPDPYFYQELCACVVPSPGANLTSEGLTEFCKTLFLTSEEEEFTAVPKYYLFFDALPTTDRGKINRRETEAVARQRLGLNEDYPAAMKNDK